MNTNGAWVSTGPSSQIPLSGIAVEIRTPKTVTLIDGASVPRKVTTTDATVGDLLKAEKITLGPNDAVSMSLSLPIKAGMQISISRNGTSIITVTQSIDAPVQKIQDSTMNEGTEKVTTAGSAGSEIVTYRVTKHNGREVGRTQLSVQVTKKPVAKVIQEGTKALPGDAIWDRDRAVRVRWQLEHQHRQRLLRWSSVQLGDLAVQRRRRLRTACRPGHQVPADRHRRQGPRCSWLRALAVCW